MKGFAAPAPAPLIFDWEVAGRELGTSLDRLYAIAVLGSHEVETAQVALGIARYQAQRRRVAIGDLLGDAAPFSELIAGEDTHGLSDVFEYGLSLDRVARRVHGDGDLYILPTGAFISDETEIMSNRRWTKLASGFREERALLVVAANAASPGIEELVMQLEGAILVGDTVPSKLPVARVIGAVRGPDAVPLPPVRPERRARPKYVVNRKPSMWKIGASFGLTLSAVIAALGIWLTYRPFAQAEWAPLWLRNAGVPADSIIEIIRGYDTAGVISDSTVTLATARHLGLLTAMDSTSQAPYGVELVNHNTQAGALLELTRNSATLRAGTFTPVLIRGTPWFRVVAGAYPDSASAAALLDTLRASGASDAGAAVIARFPYALLVERDVPDSSVATRVERYERRRLPVYALLQDDGTARLYAGAFKEPTEAEPLYEALRAAGIQTTLVYRTGRVY
ncbi:MAG: SPOR domain-containing protein [Gemmatimonadaceae bacterium]